MIALRKLYEDHGLVIESNELPDYLPMFLEFLSGLDWNDAMVYLESASRHIVPLNNELKKENCPWQTVTEALLCLASVKGAEDRLSRDDLMPDIEAESFDRPVTFGGSADPTQKGVHFYKK